MTALSRNAAIKATGAVGASMLPVGLARNEAAAREPQRVTAAAGVSGAQSATYLFLKRPPSSRRLRF